MSDQTFDPRLETLLRGALAAEVAQLPMTTTPAQVLARRADRRRSGLRSWNIGGPTAGRLRLSLSMGAVAVLAIALATLRLATAPDRLTPAAPLPTTPDAWSRVAIDAWPNAGRISSLAASTSGLLAVVGVNDRPSELFVSIDGHSWTQVPTDTHPPVDANGAGWALVGTDRGFLLSVGSGVWSSADGFEWQRLASPAENPDLRHGEMLAIAAGGPGYVAVGNGNSAWYSTDGSNWSLANVPPAPTEFFTSRGYGAPEVAMHQIVVRGDTLVAFGTASYHTEDRGLTSPVIWVSTDGRTWTDVPEALEDGEEGAVAVGPGGFVGAGNDDGQIVFRTSADGRTWEQVADLGPWRSEAADGTPRELTVESITASDAGYVAAGAFGAPCLFTCGPSDVVIWTSSDGRSWTRVPSDDQFARAAASDVVAWGDRFVVGGAQDGQPVIWISGHPPAGAAASVP